MEEPPENRVGDQAFHRWVSWCALGDLHMRTMIGSCSVSRRRPATASATCLAHTSTQ